ncbi:MAG: hypothetical protein WA751_00225, partial [Candidatus Dormiibacterota bacterium]
ARVFADDRGWWELDPVAKQRLLEANVGRSAQLGSRADPVDSADERAALASRGVDIVEMETATWLACRPGPALGLLAAVRTVTDTPTAPLGPAADLVAPGGVAPSPTRVARLILLHPGSLRRLVAIGRNQKLALEALGRAVATAVPVLERLAQSPSERTPDGRADDRAPVPAS